MEIRSCFIIHVGVNSLVPSASKAGTTGGYHHSQSILIHLLYQYTSWKCFPFPMECQHGEVCPAEQESSPLSSLCYHQHFPCPDKVGRVCYITFVGQFVSLLVLPFWLHLVAWVLWHYLLPDPQGSPGCLQLSSFPCWELYLDHHFWLHCPENPIWGDVLS